MILLKLEDFLADEFKACENLHQGHAVAAADFFCHVGSDDGLNHRSVFGKRPFALFLAQDIVEQDDADLVARQRNVFAR